LLVKGKGGGNRSYAQGMGTVVGQLDHAIQDAKLKVVEMLQTLTKMGK
jgi:hypothetical protein